MGGLGHFLEDEGLATVQISLIREHTEKMRAPRALWVPFMLGRPLGVPDDADFQTRVLRAALALLQAPSGPVLENYPEEAPASDVEADGWVCPISFQNDAELSLGDRLRHEIQQYRTWYDLHVEKRGRTAVGVSGLEMEAVADFLAEHAEGRMAPSPDPQTSAARMVRLSVDDLRTFLYEAAEAQPGSATPGQLNEWFWTSTTAGEAILQLWRRVRESEEADFKRLSMLIVPREWIPKDV